MGEVYGILGARPSLGGEGLISLSTMPLGREGGSVAGLAGQGEVSNGNWPIRRARGKEEPQKIVGEMNLEYHPITTGIKGKVEKNNLGKDSNPSQSGYLEYKLRRGLESSKKKILGRSDRELTLKAQNDERREEKNEKGISVMG